MFRKQKDNILQLLMIRLCVGILFISALYVAVQFIPNNQIAYYVIALLLSSLFLDMFHNTYQIFPSFLDHTRIHNGIRISPQSLFLLGVFVSLAYFDTSIVFLATLLTLISPLVGQLIRHYPLLPKYSRSWQACILVFIVNMATLLLFIHAWEILIPLSLIAAYIESIATFNEDNLLIPVSVSFIGQILIDIFM